MTIDKDKLKALAKLATQGDWERDGYQVCPVADQNASLGSFGKSTDAAYVAALQPSAILALLAEIDDQALQARSAREVCLESQAAILSLISERDQLKAENEALRKQNEELPKTIQAQLEAFLGEAKRDAERYRWLRSRDLETISQGGVFAGITPQNMVLNEETLDQAVDAAMTKEKIQ